MKQILISINASIFYSLIFLGISCKKQDSFLNTKPVSSLSTITTLSDLQNILNNEDVFNRFATPQLGEASTDDYYVSSSQWENLESVDQNTYIWIKDIFPAGSTVNDWNDPYKTIYLANTVLDALTTIKFSSDQQSLADQIKGTALFYRSISFYNLTQTFALPYDSSTSSSDLGIPLRLSSNLNIKSVRSTEKQCYDQILSDLQTAVELLPVSSHYVTQPNKVSANALLARIYIAMGKYENSLEYSNKSLGLNNNLFDYNNIIPNPAFYLFADGSQYPLTEDIYHSLLGGSGLVGGIVTPIVDSVLYNSYDSNDLRKSTFFTSYNDEVRFRGSYEFENYGYFYDGLAIDEMYLIRAESNARLGNINEALADLDALLVKRYKSGTYVKRTAINAEDALKQILSERRKELCFRGLRWTDLRRLNKDSRFAITLKRSINGVTYSLPPGDPRYALPIPEDEILASGIQQNVR